MDLLIQSIANKWDRELFYNMTDKIKELLISIKINEVPIEGLTFEEGFYSANIEGASTTLERYTAITGMKDIARNKDEYMSKNTYIAENYLKMNSYNEIDHALIKELHRIIISFIFLELGGKRGSPLVEHLDAC